MKQRSQVLLMASAIIVVLAFLGFVLIQAFAIPPNDQHPNRTRAEAIPESAQKVLPTADDHPPLLHSSLWFEPVPLGGPINTAGAEDSPFILPDGNTLYFFFTPDVSKTPQEQLFDQVTGIWSSNWNGSGWSEPERVWLQEIGLLALDGAAFVQGDSMWFASAREGYTGVNLFTAQFQNGEWRDWQYAGDRLNKDFQVGEMHISADGKEMYFHSNRTGGLGALDIWVMKYLNGEWQVPTNLAAVNSAADEGWPFISQDGSELWFSRTYFGTPAIYRSLKVDGNWSAPELIVSTFAGEPTLDIEGNLYFVHHFYENNVMIEADIYVAYKK